MRFSYYVPESTTDLRATDGRVMCQLKEFEAISYKNLQYCKYDQWYQWSKSVIVHIESFGTLTTGLPTLSHCCYEYECHSSEPSTEKGISDVIYNEMEQIGVAPEKIMGLGSDRASVITNCG